MNVAIIGCGYSGLSAIRRCTEYNIECVAFELSGEVGGLWVYTEKVGIDDEFGIPIQTSLYYNLRTNSPKQTLEFPDFQFETEENTCYPRHTEVKQYLNKFANHFNLLPYIKFFHYVTHVCRSNNDKWKITVKNLKKEKEEIYYFDAVLIGNGHTTEPFIPKINGLEQFKGFQLHCHDYRRNTIFTNKNVLIVGNGPSGMEVVQESSSVANKTYLSQRENVDLNLPLIISKPQIETIEERMVTFIDGTSINIDVIVFCTGYKYFYPFLDFTCGITVEDDGQIIKPLYKHYININFSTMCFIGLFQRTIISYLFDLQVQAFLKFLTGQITLPTKIEMLKWFDEENKQKIREKLPRNHYYHLSANIKEYFDDIVAYAKLKNIPPVLFKIFRENQNTYATNFYNFRRLYFEIIDEENYRSSLKSLQ